MQACLRDAEVEVAPIRTESTAARFEQLLREDYPGLIKLLARRCGGTAEAQDLLQEAICIAIEHHSLGRIANVERISGYVFRTALNLLRNHRRMLCNRADRRGDEEALENLPCEGSANDEVDELLANQVRAALAALPVERDRVIIKRFYLDEELKPAICRDLGISALHFDKVVYRARQRMKQILLASP